MNEQHKKNNRTILIIFAMSVIPFIIAWFLANDTRWMQSGTNNGELILPPLTTEKKQFTGFDSFSTENMAELTGRWVLINVINHKDCAEFCQQAIYKSKQLRLMMNKDLTRIRRMVVIIPELNELQAKDWWKDDGRLLRVRAEQPVITKIKSAAGGEIAEGKLFLMDPLGNIMMHYPPDFDPYKVKRDLSKLLRISQIG